LEFFIMSKMLSVIGLVDTAAAILSASECIEAAALHTIAHGNKRNFIDTLAALQASGAKTKGGEIAKNRKGEIYSVTLAALNSANSAAAALASVKALPSFKAAAAAAAANIAEAFAEAAKPQPKAAKPKAAAAKPEAAKPEAAAALDPEEQAEAAAIAAAKAEAEAKAAKAAAEAEAKAEAEAAAAALEAAKPENLALGFVAACPTIEAAALAIIAAAKVHSLWKASDFAGIFAALAEAEAKAEAAAAALAAKPKAAKRKAA
jgi:hypothetical protein